MNRAYERSQIGVAIAGGHGYRELLETALFAEENGLSTCWISEDYFYGGAMATAGAIAALTSRIQIGVGVINPYTRTPALAAMEAAAVDNISNGRFILAMGASNRRWIEDRMGIPFSKPITSVMESVQIIRGVLSGEPVNFQGEIFQNDNVHLDFTPYRKDMPVYMGIRGARALKLAGAHADGVLLSIMSSAPYVAYARRMIDEGAREAGRDPKEVKLSAYIPLYVGEFEAGKQAMANTMGMYIARSAAQPFIQQSGLTEAEARPLVEAFERGENPAALVSDAIADRFGVIGDAAHVWKRLAEYKAAGLDEPVLCEYEQVPAKAQMEMLLNELFD